MGSKYPVLASEHRWNQPAAGSGAPCAEESCGAAIAARSAAPTAQAIITRQTKALLLGGRRMGSSALRSIFSILSLYVAPRGEAPSLSSSWRVLVVSQPVLWMIACI